MNAIGRLQGDETSSHSHQMARSLSNFIPLNLEVETTESLTAVAGHICVSYKGCLICWGGYCYDEREIHYRECNWLYIFPYMLWNGDAQNNNIWLKVQCETSLQLRPNSGATAGVHRDKLYIFGGCLFDDIHRRMINTSMLIEIDLRTGLLISKSYPPNGRIPTPRDKTTSWIADEKFFIFGGYGMSWHRLDHNSANQYFFQPESFLDDMGSCWNNQLLFYDLQNECWQEVNHGGHKPSQRAAAASVYVPEINQVFLFGGRHDQTRLNDLYSLDLTKFIWTKIDFSADIRDLPEGRSWCTMVLLADQRKIMCYGGLCSRGQPLSDLWELDISSFYNRCYQYQRGNFVKKAKKSYWHQIPPMEHKMPARLWHCSVLMGNEAILHYGGMNEAPSSDSPFVSTLILQRLKPPTLCHIAMNALVDHILNLWLTEWTKQNAIAHRQLGPQEVSSTNCLDLQSFAVASGFLCHLPVFLHAQLRLLLTMKKHAKSLNHTGDGGSTPRASSSHRWHPSPFTFHMLNLDGMMEASEEENDDGAESDNFLRLHRPRRHRNVPLSPKSQKRALSDELVKQICEMAKAQNKPFLQTLFQALNTV